MTDARPRYRKLALATSTLCFLLAGIIAIAPIGPKYLAGGTCLVVGLVMLTISQTGRPGLLPRR